MRRRDHESQVRVGRLITLFALPSWVVASLFLAVYVLLDFVSYIFPLAPFGITPWNPYTGLSFVAILLGGRRYLPLLFVGPLLADLFVRGMPVPLWIEALAVAVVGGGYAAATSFLLRPQLHFDPTISSLRDLFWLLMVAGASAALVACAYALVFAGGGLLPWEQFWPAVLHYWVGDTIGVFVVTPFLLSIFGAPRLPTPTVERAAQLASVCFALWVIFGFARASEFQFFYLLFLPIVWAAARAGLEGVSAALFITQAGLILALDWTDQPVADVAKFQLLMLILALTGLFLGVAISQQERSMAQLRLHREALARAARLTSLSALTAELVHELNQPLTAIGNYARIVRDMIGSGEGLTSSALETAEKGVAQVEHASRLIGRFRDFVRTGESEVVPTSVSLFVAEAIQLARPLLENVNVKVTTSIPPNISRALVDRLQIEQVLLNLITNSVEAIASLPQPSGHIAIEVGFSQTPETMDIRLSDNGPGFDPDMLSTGATAFSTTKQDGMGLGLTLSRSIIEKLGGRITLANDAEGAVVTVTLPRELEAGHVI